MVMTENPVERIYNPEGNNFRNVADKVRNARLHPDTAWNELQPLLANYVPEYPEKYKPYQELLKEIFEIRRAAYFYPERRENASKEIRNKLSTLRDQTQELLTAPVVCIRDLFDLEAPNKKPRGFR